jgi:hypothetical protein
VFFFYIETRNTPLEEIVRHFDGEAALLGGDLATEKSRDYLVEEGNTIGTGNTIGSKGVATTGSAEVDDLTGRQLGETRVGSNQEKGL